MVSRTCLPAKHLTILKNGTSWIRPSSRRWSSPTLARNLARIHRPSLDQAKMQLTEQQSQHLFQYTSGRWLWNEKEQLRSRYKPFNVDAAMQAAASAVGSSICISIEKIGEGSYNKAFRLVMDDGTRVIMKIPTPGSGHPLYSTASEVATMDFARCILCLPVPKILAYSTTEKNSVEAEYILMDEASGQQLDGVWHELSSGVKLSIMRQLVQIEAKFTSISFTHYGSLYLADQDIPCTIPATISGKCSEHLRESVAKRYRIGPSAKQDFWCAGRDKLDIDRGPWKSPLDCLKAGPLREIAYIESDAEVHQSSRLVCPDVPSQSSPSQHLKLQRMLLKVLPHLIDVDQILLTPKLWHTDLYGRNIFVQGEQISSIIDWQGICVEPFMMCALPAGLIDFQGTQRLKRPENYHELSEHEQARIRLEISRSTLLQLYLREVERSNPELASALQVDHGKTRLNAINFGKNSYDDDIVAFREALLNVNKYLPRITTTSPIQPLEFTDNDISTHLEEAEGWNERADFFEKLEGILQPDGWTSHETYDQANEVYSELMRLEENGS